MRIRAFYALRTLAVCACLTSCAAAAFAATTHDANEVSPATRRTSPPQEQPNDKKKEKKEKPPTVPEPELKAAKAIEAAADVPAMLAAANEFFQKYPKSPLRPQIAPIIADRISQIADPAQRIAQSENYLKLFTAPGDIELVNQSLLSGYTEANRLDEAFALAPTAVDKNADPLGAMINLTRGALAEARNKNLKYVAPGRQMGIKAIALIESNKKPEAVSDATWNDYKTRWHSQLYQWVAMLSLEAGDKADAKAKLMSAIRLNPHDPINYVLLSTMANDEYQRLVQAHKAATGAEKDALLKQAEAQMDEVIDAYAHAVALTEGNAQYDSMRVGLKADLESYYKYRHGNSTDGLQALIDKYKKP
jgi:tetratricopeptide (TPR) repeat protein